MPCSAPEMFFKFYLFIFGCAGSSLLRGLSLVTASGGYSLIAVLGLLISMATLVVEHRLWDARAQNYGAQLPVACGIFLNLGANLCPLCWQSDS